MIDQEQMEAEMPAKLLQPRLFAVGHQQPPSPGCLCIYGGKVSVVDLPVGVDVDILHRTNELQLARQAIIRALKRKIKSKAFSKCRLNSVKKNVGE